MGDVFHAMDRIKDAVKNEEKNTSFVAVRRAYSMLNNNKLEECERNTKAVGMTAVKTKKKKNYLQALYHRYIYRCMERPKELYIRVGLVYV